MINLLLFYICYNEEDYVDYIYEESTDIINKFDSKYPEIVDLYKVRYLNFKGRYKESIQIIENDRIKNKNTDDFNLLLADIAFNTNKINQGIYIVSKLCKNYYQKNICVQNSIDVLINTYIGNINVEKGGQDNGFSSEKNMWNKVKTSKEKTLLLLIKGVKIQQINAINIIVIRFDFLSIIRDGMNQLPRLFNQGFDRPIFHF